MKNIFFYDDKSFYNNFTGFLKTRQKTNAEIMCLVRKVIDDVKMDRDQALVEYTKKFDNFDLNRTGVFFQPNEIEESIKKTDLLDREAIDMSIARIWKFHKKQMPKNLSWKDELGIELGWVWKPIDRVGVYVPGGKASSFFIIKNIIP